MKTKNILTTLLVLSFVITAFAQQGINYKAIIKDGDGNAIANTAVTIQFTILDGTAPIFAETHTPTTDANGIVIVNIGEFVEIGDLSWNSNNPYFLNTKIDTGSGLTDMGTTEFKTVPYALHALNSSGSVTELNDLSDVQTNSNNSISIGQSPILNSYLIGSTSIGYGANTGEWGTALGSGALGSNLSSRNTAIGAISLSRNTSGASNTAVGFHAIQMNTTGNYNTAIGYESLGELLSGSNNIGIGNNAQVPNGQNSNQIQIGNEFISYAGCHVEWSVSSDIRWKENIRSLPYGLDMLMQLEPVDYTRKNNEKKIREMGFIAQDVEKVLNKMGYTDQGILSKDDKGFMSLRYNDFIILLTKAVQEQQDIINNLKDKIEMQEKNIKGLNAELGQLSALDNRIKVLEEYQRVAAK